MIKYTLIGIMTVFCLGSVLSAWAANTSPRRVVTETPVTPPGMTRLDTLTFSPDGKRLAYVQELDGEQSIVVDGASGKAYESIRSPWEIAESGNLPTTHAGIFFSPNGKRVAYAVKTNRQWAIVVDGQEGTFYDDVDLPIFSADSAHMAYKARTGDKWRVIVDGKEGKPYESIGAGEGFMGERKAPYLVFSPDGAHTAYVAGLARETVDAPGNYCVVADGKEEPAYERIYDITFSQNGQHLAYVAENGRNTFIVADGQEGPFYTRVGFPLFSPNGERFIYLASADRKKYFAVVDGQPGTAYDSIKPVTFSPDGKHYAFVAQTDNRQCMVIDGREGAQFTQVFYPVFSTNGKRMAYMAVEGKQWCVVIDGTPGRYFDSVWPPVFSADGAHIAYVARINDQTTVILDRQVGPGVTGLITNLQFTPDGQHVLYEARDTTGKALPVTIAMDNRPGKRYERLLPRAEEASHFFIDGPDRFHYYIEKNKTVYKVEERLDVVQGVQP